MQQIPNNAEREDIYNLFFSRLMRARHDGTHSHACACEIVYDHAHASQAPSLPIAFANDIHYRIDAWQNRRWFVFCCLSWAIAFVVICISWHSHGHWLLHCFLMCVWSFLAPKAWIWIHDCLFVWSSWCFSDLQVCTCFADHGFLQKPRRPVAFDFTGPLPGPFMAPGSVKSVPHSRKFHLPKWMRNPLSGNSVLLGPNQGCDTSGEHNKILTRHFWAS